MNGNAASSAGMGPDDGGRAADHPSGARGSLDRARDHLAEAKRVLTYSNKQEAQIALSLIEAALLAVDFAEKGLSRSEGVGEEDGPSA